MCFCGVVHNCFGEIRVGEGSIGSSPLNGWFWNGCWHSGCDGWDFSSECMELEVKVYDKYEGLWEGIHDLQRVITASGREYTAFQKGIYDRFRANTATKVDCALWKDVRLFKGYHGMWKRVYDLLNKSMLRIRSLERIVPCERMFTTVKGISLEETMWKRVYGLWKKWRDYTAYWKGVYF